MVFLALFLFGLVCRLSLSSSFMTVEEVDMADGGRVGTLVGGGMASDADDVARLIAGCLPVVGLRDMIAIKRDQKPVGKVC